MKKVTFKIDKAREFVIPSINSTLDNLNEVIKRSSQLYIPSDFKYYHYLNNMAYDVIQTKTKLINIKEWIQSCNLNFNEKLEQIRQELQEIENTEIKKRESSIN